MTQIQASSIPVVMDGSDVIIKSESGSGKTTAYLVPIINALIKKQNKVERSQGTYTLVLTPTRGSTMQCFELALKLVNESVYIIVGQLVGNENLQEKARLIKGINILFGTPGRVL